MCAAERSANRPGVSVALIWHMHQPDLRDPTGVGDLMLPWVRLNACRAYTDVAWLLERHPHVKATVAISPVLADQIDDLAHMRCGDRFLDLSRRPTGDLSHMDRVEILRGFFMTDWEREVRPLSRYWQLLHKRGRDLKSLDLDRVADTFTETELHDLQVLFNLVWMGSMARATEPLVQNLFAKGQRFTEVEKLLLLDLQEDLVAKVLPRWRKLAATGQVELCTSPYFQPILPLLADTDAAREAMPDARLPPRCRRPKDAMLQVERGIDAHRRHFGMTPAGLWPAEGSASHLSALMVAGAGFSWMAGDESVLRRSTAEDGSHPRPTDHHHVWEAASDATRLALFCRDRALSDLIGFSYSANPPDEAAADMMRRLAAIGRKHEKHSDGCGTVVTIALNGEGPWEHYLDSGRPFLEALYRQLAVSEHHGVKIRTTTPREWLNEHTPSLRLSRLHSGSWVDGSFRAWIGHPETNRAWTLIDEAGRILEARGPDLAPENREEALIHLLAAEGADWTWWYGGDFKTETPEAYDALFRARLTKIFELTGEATPARLRRAISPAAALGQGIVPLREPWSLITPVVDGQAAPYVDWQGAGVYRPRQNLGRMYHATSRMDALHYGCDITELYLRLDLSDEGRTFDELGELCVHLVSSDRETDVSFIVRRGEGHGRLLRGAPGLSGDIGRFAYGDTVEIALPFEPLGLPGGEVVLFVVRLLSDDVEIERLPRYGHLSIRAPHGSAPLGGWQA